MLAKSYEMRSSVVLPRIRALRAHKSLLNRFICIHSFSIHVIKPIQCLPDPKLFTMIHRNHNMPVKL